MRITIFLVVLLSYSSFAKTSESLPLMPYPQSVELLGGHYAVSKTLRVVINGMSEERQKFAIDQLESLLAKRNVKLRVEALHSNALKSAHLTIDVNQGQPSPFALPKLNHDESYQLTIDEAGIKIVANTDFGALHGLASLSQLLLAETESALVQLPQLLIEDTPRFPWRGLMLDSVRHFLPVDTIKRQLNGMVAAKLNVFHWHLTDDQGWRIESKLYPRLHQRASDGQYYRQKEIREIVAYASLRGIRVVPEFDAPGHASAIAVAYPEFITEQKIYSMEDEWGVFEPLLDPTKPEVYEFIDGITSELASLFPDEYVHIGGDEVNPKQWQDSQKVQLYMQDHGFKRHRGLTRAFQPSD